MESPEDKQWASKYLLDPLTAPEPSQEDGPGSHFINPQRANSVNTQRTNKSRSPKTYPTPPGSASPSQSTFSSNNPFASSSSQHRKQAFAAYADDTPARKSSERKSAERQELEAPSVGRRRGSSLGQRYPGDMSNRPLDQIRKESKAANRAPHLKKKHMVGADLIDSLDASFLGSAYHHEGPYDATLLARNTNVKISPVAATNETNAEAIKATPREQIKDSLTRHVPLQGTAVIPPGEMDHFGQQMNYKEGADVMRDPDAPGGAYKRWDHIQYHPDDLKGKGGPQYLIDRSLKNRERDQQGHRRVMSDGDSAYEMQNQTRPEVGRQRSQSQVGPGRDGPPAATGNSLNYANAQNDMQRSNTTGRKMGEGLKKRLGSLRKNRKTTEV